MDNLIKKSVNDSDMKKEEPPPGAVISDIYLDANSNQQNKEIDKIVVNKAQVFGHKEGSASAAFGSKYAAEWDKLAAEWKELEDERRQIAEERAKIEEQKKKYAEFSPAASRDGSSDTTGAEVNPELKKAREELEAPSVVLSDNVITKMDTSGDDSKSDGTDAAAITITDSGGPELNKVPMNERRRFLITVRMILRQIIRDKFGVEFSNRCGHWLDRYMTHLVWKYGYWLDYPDGNRILKGHNDDVLAAAVSTDGRYLFTVQYDGMIFVWDLLDYSILKQFNASDKRIRCLIYERDLLVFTGENKKIRILNGITHDLVRTLDGHSSFAHSLQFNKACTQIVSASHDTSVKVWCIKTGNCLATLIGHTERVYSACFMDNDTRVISGTIDGSIRVWSMTDKIECDTIIDDQIINHLCVNCDSSLVACCTGFNGLCIYNWPKMNIVLNLRLSMGKGEFHPSNPDILAVTVPQLYWVRIYNVQSGDMLAEWEAYDQPQHGLCWSRDGYRLVSIFNDDTVRVWDCTGLI